jgi:hypothetical protein
MEAPGCHPDPRERRACIMRHQALALAPVGVEGEGGLDPQVTRRTRHKNVGMRDREEGRGGEGGEEREGE